MNLRLLEQVDEQTFAAKNTELRDQAAELSNQLQSAGGRDHNHANLAVKAFELSQSLKDNWVKSKLTTRRQLLQIIGLNWQLDGVTLIPTIRNPFNLSIEGLVLNNSRGERTSIELFLAGLAGWDSRMWRLTDW